MLLIPAPRLTGGCPPKSAWGWARPDTQMSNPPIPPGRALVEWAIDHRAQVLAGTPRVAGSGALRYPKVFPAERARPVRREVEAAPILRQLGQKVLERRVD